MSVCVNCGTALRESACFCGQCGHPVDRRAGVPTTEDGLSVPRNVAALLCYVLPFIGGLVFLVLEPYDRDSFVRFHAFQSIFFSVSAVLVGTLVGAIPGIGAFLWYLVGLGVFAVWLLLLARAAAGKRWKLPLIGLLAERQV